MYDTHTHTQIHNAPTITSKYIITTEYYLILHNRININREESILKYWKERERERKNLIKKRSTQMIKYDHFHFDLIELDIFHRIHWNKLTSVIEPRKFIIIIIMINHNNKKRSRKEEEEQVSDRNEMHQRFKVEK